MLENIKPVSSRISLLRIRQVYSSAACVLIWQKSWMKQRTWCQVVPWTMEGTLQAGIVPVVPGGQLCFLPASLWTVWWKEHTSSVAQAGMSSLLKVFLPASVSNQWKCRGHQTGLWIVFELISVSFSYWSPWSHDQKLTQLFNWSHKGPRCF